MSRKLPFNAVKLIFLGGFYLFLLVLYATAAPAQGMSIGDEQQLQERVQEMAEKLQLTEDQRQALIPIMQDYGLATKAMLEKHDVDLEPGERPSRRKMMAMRGDVQKNRSAFEQQLATVLSPQQMDEFHRLQKEQREAMRARLRRTN
ncbi:hypothetical protein [Nitratireductor sp. XY-223]|uniref:hypothetical protein n=1 Tax=Nitratireductor sp. XY-223 TaxID=2561926 RepID=UPI0010AA967E|nr:hypothetical protein [Nitratireductor sp. XY-223]